jgi:hypothetical protein
MPEFRIANYVVSQVLQRFSFPPTPTETRRGRLLVLKSEPLYHNIVIAASLNFSTFFDGWNGRGVVGYAQGFDTFAPSIAGWYPLAEYETVYELFRSERPLYLVYELENPSQASSYITLLQVRSDPVALSVSALLTANLQRTYADLYLQPPGPPPDYLEPPGPPPDSLQPPGPLPARTLVGPASGRLPKEVLEEAMQQGHTAEGTSADPKRQRDERPRRR